MIIFDWGGTLVHTQREPAVFGPCARGAVDALRAAGVPVDAAAADNLRRTFEETWRARNTIACQEEFDPVGFFQDWAARERVALPERLDAVIDALWQPWVGCLEPLGDIVATLERLAAQGIALGLVSNCATVPHVCHVEIARQGIAPLLAFSLFSSELGVRKPHPRVYEVALARAADAVDGNGSGGLAPGDVLFVGDTPSADVAGPARAGMKTGLVRTGNWRGEVAELVHPPDLVVETVHELPRVWG
ncbi:MAG: HAD family hydrolase [Phycisphaerales bacterium]|nr:HAD family hydrolase [Phycisphaerales bacterium]